MLVLELDNEDVFEKVDEEEDAAVGDQDAAEALRDTDSKEGKDNDNNNESTADDLQKLAEFNFQLAQAKAELFCYYAVPHFRIVQT